MGYMLHHAIVITTYKNDELHKVATKAKELGLQVLGPSEESPVNGYFSLLICPDGSKEGWPESEEGNKLRRKFIEWLETQRHEDGSSWLEWVEIAYGNDPADAQIANHAWINVLPNEG